MKLLTYESGSGPRVAVLTEAGVEDVVPETGDAAAVIAAGGTPKTSGTPKPLSDVKLLPPIAELRRPVIAVGVCRISWRHRTVERFSATIEPGVYSLHATSA